MTDDSSQQIAIMMVKLESLIKEVASLVREVRTDYVRKENYEARHMGLTRRVDELEREADERERDRKAFQRQIVGGLVIGGILMLAQTGLTVIMLLGGIK